MVDGLLFPCWFPLRVIGEDLEGIQALVVEIVQRHVPSLDLAEVTVERSSKGRYASINMHFNADTREQMDALYKELTACKEVKWVL